MKLATLRDGTADGRLVVVSHDLAWCSDARHIAATLQAALDAWDEAAPELELIARGIATGGQPVERFHERDARSPLPRGFLDPRAPLGLADECIGLTPAVAVITGAVATDTPPAGAAGAVRLAVLASGGPACAFAPVAVTPDELGAAWSGGRLEAALRIEINGRPSPAAGSTAADFGALIARAATPGGLAPGSIVGLTAGSDTPALVLRLGDTLRVEMRDASGHSIFGAIEQTVAPAAA